MTTPFNGKKLREVREARGMTITALAELSGISRQSISKYEHGESMPDLERLEQMASALNVPIRFFLSREVFTPEENRVFFRSLSAATKTARARSIRRLGWLRDIVGYLAREIEFPPLNLRRFDLPSDPASITDEAIEQVAMEVRALWGLGDGPVDHMVRRMERNGIIVSRGALDEGTLDAYSMVDPDDEQWVYVFLSSDKDSAVRSRFDAAHELGHLVLHRNIEGRIMRRSPEHKLMESQAMRFAGAFLLPLEFADDFVLPTLDALVTLKYKWKVSVGAMLMRARQLHLISEAIYERLIRNYSRRGWRRREPLDDELPAEEPILLRRAFEVLLEDGSISRSQVLENLPYAPTDIEDLAGLPRGFFEHAGDSSVPVPIRRKQRRPRPTDSSQSSSMSADGGTIIQFPRDRRR